ncbi:PLAC8 family [Pelomyxa schiedti]|nr:PLAC8 family [Pelomyxa schiedti]
MDLLEKIANAIEPQDKWNNKFCGCLSDPVSCLISWCIPCVQYGMNAEKHGEGIVGNSMIVNAAVWCLLGMCGLSFWPTCQQRQSIRNKYNIDGTPVGDCILSWCCGCCALSQAHRELHSR